MAYVSRAPTARGGIPAPEFFQVDDYRVKPLNIPAFLEKINAFVRKRSP